MNPTIRYTILALVSLIIAFGGISAVNKYFSLKDDHPIEELVEDAIEAGTGVEIDLTPESPEK